MSSPELSVFSEVKHATALINPVSTTNRKGVRRLKRLIENAPFRIEAIPTSINPNITKAIITAALENSDLLIIIAGDGTFNNVLDTIVRNNLSKQAKATPLLSLGGGNAEDGYKAKHTPLHRRHPERVLQDGRIVETYPIRCDITHSNGEKNVRSAAFYATLGASALASSVEYLNSSRHRQSWTGQTRLGRLFSEPIVVARAFNSAGVNTVLDDGQPKSFYEEIFANSHIMAKYMHFPTSLTKQELFHAEIKDKTLLAIGRNVLDGLRGTLDGEFMSPAERINFQTIDNLWTQFDGEASIIPANSAVSIGIHDQPIRVVVTNPDL